MKITKKESAKGKITYRVQGYLGVHPITGKQVNFDKSGFPTKSLAQTAYRKAKLAFDSGTYEISSPETYAEVYRTWCELYKEQVMPSTYAKTTGRITSHILPAIGHLPLKAITPLVCQALAGDLREVYADYKKVYHDAERIFTYAIQIGLTTRANPFERVILPKPQEKAKREKLLSVPQIESFLAILKEDGKPFWYTFYRLLAYTGLRRGEALALTWKDIDFLKSTLTVSKTISRGQDGEYLSDTPKTKAGYRTIALDRETLATLATWRKLQKVVGLRPFVFGNAKGSWTGVAVPVNFLTRFCKLHQLSHLDNHTFRHSHCTMLFEAGWSIKEVQKRMGHADIKTTLGVYTHVTEEKKKESMEKLESFIQKIN